MKKTKHLFTALLLLCATVVSAHDFVSDGIYYNIIDDDAKTLEVTYRGDIYHEHTDRYTGSVSIPKKVIMGQLTYTVERIGEFAFANCDGLTSIEMQNNITSIGELAFYNCYNLANVTIPASCRTLGAGAFGSVGGYSEKKVCDYKFLGAEPPTVYANTFTSNRIGKIEVPVGCAEIYKSATNWSIFAEFIVEEEI